MKMNRSRKKLDIYQKKLIETSLIGKIEDK